MAATQPMHTLREARMRGVLLVSIAFGLVGVFQLVLLAVATGDDAAAIAGALYAIAIAALGTAALGTAARAGTGSHAIAVGALRSMAASPAPRAPDRLARARAFALALRPRLASIPVGVASFTDRVRRTGLSVTPARNDPPAPAMNSTVHSAGSQFS